MENKDQPSFPRVLIQFVVPYWNTKNNGDNKTLFIEGNTKHLQTNKLVAIKFHVLFPTAFRVLLNMIFKICLIFSLFSPSLARGQRSRVCHQSH